jgi:hypothetical protein
MVSFLRSKHSSRGLAVSESFFVVLIAIGLTLTTYFGIAAWHASDDRQNDIVARIQLVE